jgi:imidazolonepropionase
MKTIITNIGLLSGILPVETKKVSGAEMSNWNGIENAFIEFENEIISDFGSMLGKEINADKVIDAKGGFVLPVWCDSHTHLVFAAWREKEFVDKLNGLGYEEIAQRGGGILISAKKLAEASEDELFDFAWQRLEEIKQTGTGAVEIKSGYGLCFEGELKMLRVIRKLKEQSDLTIKATFLGAHAYPLKYRENHEGYIKMLIDEMLPKIADEDLADFIDVFCEKGYFSVEETDRILQAGAKYGLVPKVHVNQFNAIGGVAVSVKNNARSVDHLEQLTDEDIEALKYSNTMPVALPGCSFFLRIQYTPARKIIDAGLPLAIASDYNPGSSPSGNIPFAASLACLNMSMSTNEVLNATTINGAYSMGVEKELGSITIGKKANLIITEKIPSLDYLPYRFSSNCIAQTILNGKV